MSEDGRIIVAVGIVIEDGRALIAKRRDDVPLPGLWEFPGGKLEPGETPEQAAERELAEELSITVRATGRLTPLEHTYPHGTVVLTPVLCQRLAGEPHPVQAAACRWVGLADLAAYPFPAANAPMLKELVSRLLQRPPGDATLHGP